VNVGIHDVDPVRVGEGCVRAFPGCDTATAGAESDGGVLDPGGAETVEEVCLAGYFAVFDVGGPELADVDGVLVAVEAGVVEAAVGVADADC